MSVKGETNEKKQEETKTQKMKADARAKQAPTLLRGFSLDAFPGFVSSSFLVSQLGERRTFTRFVLSLFPSL